MGCNAWNHPPNCNCGWGGVWYGSNNGSDSWLFNKQGQVRLLGTQRGTSERLAGGYTNPNAVCPVCSEKVFYYESPYGGRVFFDELGPPWPKHSCTSNEESTSVSSVKPWHLDDWEPLVSVQINSYNSKDKCLYSIQGVRGSSKIQLYFRATQPTFADIVRYKKTPQMGVFILSILYYEPLNLAWHVVDVKAFTSDVKAMTEGQTAIFLQVHGEKQFKPLDTTFSQEIDKKEKEKYEQIGNLKGLICPWCDRRQKGNLIDHLFKRHGLVALGEIDKLTGLLRVRDIQEEQQNRLKKIEKATIKLFNGDDDAAIKWIYSHHSDLGKHRPITLIYDDSQVDKVLRFIKNLIENKEEKAE